MKKTIVFLILLSTILTLSSCGITNTNSQNSTLSEIQNVVRETQTAFENGNISRTNEGIEKLIEMGENPLYSKSEKMIASYCALYIRGGVMLDYIIKNDKAWLETHNVDEFQEFHSQMFVEVINGRITHVDTLQEYGHALYQSVQEIATHYNELHK